jgi:hypothetical protein
MILWVKCSAERRGFFIVRRIVSGDAVFVSVCSRVTQISAHNRSAQQALPSGAGPQTRAVSRASSSPARLNYQ